MLFEQQQACSTVEVRPGSQGQLPFSAGAKHPPSPPLGTARSVHAAAHQGHREGCGCGLADAGEEGQALAAQCHGSCCTRVRSVLLPASACGPLCCRPTSLATEQVLLPPHAFSSRPAPTKGATTTPRACQVL